MSTMFNPMMANRMANPALGWGNNSGGGGSIHMRGGMRWGQWGGFCPPRPMPYCPPRPMPYCPPMPMPQPSFCAPPPVCPPPGFFNNQQVYNFPPRNRGLLGLGIAGLVVGSLGLLAGLGTLISSLGNKQKLNELLERSETTKVESDADPDVDKDDPTDPTDPRDPEGKTKPGGN